MLIGILFAVLTGITWVWIGIVISHASRNDLNIPYIQFFQVLIGMIISLLLLGGMYISGLESVEISAQTKWITAAAVFANGFLNYYMLIVMGLAMKRGPNGIVWSTVQSGLIFPFLMGILLFHVAPTPLRLTGFFMIVVSVLLFGFGKKKKEEKQKSVTTGKIHWYWYALFAMLLCGLNQCFGNLPSYLSDGPKTGSVFRAMFTQAGTLSAWLLGSLWQGRLLHPQFQKGEVKKLILFAISLNIVGLLSSYLLFYNSLDALAEAGAGSLGYPLIVCSCIIGFFLYSVLFLREKTDWMQIAGFLIGVFGIIIICL